MPGRPPARSRALLALGRMVARDGTVETTCVATSACYQVLYLPYLEHVGCVRVRCGLVVCRAARQRVHGPRLLLVDCGAGWHGGNDVCGHFSVLPGAVFALVEHMGCVRVRYYLVVFITMIIVKVDFPASTTTRSKK